MQTKNQYGWIRGELQGPMRGGGREGEKRTRRERTRIWGVVVVVEWWWSGGGVVVVLLLLFVLVLVLILLVFGLADAGAGLADAGAGLASLIVLVYCLLSHVSVSGLPLVNSQVTRGNWSDWRRLASIGVDWSRLVVDRLSTGPIVSLLNTNRCLPDPRTSLDLCRPSVDPRLRLKL
ncbi:hypothetical protein BKA91DRAFT_24994 [Yarrowia lipolytica]|nr:hypothetical protein BKA91DRAFT_24994 [Yarrowia lipolytica]KAE8172812.1 hypothetical protein BKA90DRAFT_14964 [Yarrowia lipolytica]RMI93913.1 hypothetical protein BD777DRAFT_32993 [Yarrowia lipolytica]